MLKEREGEMAPQLHRTSQVLYFGIQWVLVLKVMLSDVEVTQPM